MKKILLVFTIFLSLTITAHASTMGTTYCPDDDEPINVRNTPGGTSVGALACNTQLEILNNNAGSTSNCSTWYQVRQGILTGYACGDYVKINNNNTEVNKVICIENNDPLNIWSTTSRSSKLKSLNCGDEITVLEKNVDSNSGCSNWYKVESGGVVGYSCGKYISSVGTSNIIDYSTLGKSSTGDNIYKKENYDTKPSGDGTIMCYEDAGDLTLRNSPGGASTGHKVSCGDVVTINDEANGSGSCPYYYKVTNASGNSGYVCGYFVNTTKLSTTALNYYNGTVDVYYETLRKKGFPESYLPYLAEVHARHPNWEFNAEKINLDFNDVVAGESAYGRNLVQGSAFNQNYYSMDINTYDLLNNKFNYYSTEEGWYNASTEAIAYFLDPRNYLNEKYIFAFESLKYNSAHNVDMVNKILSGQTFWPTVYSNYDGNVANDIMTATSNIGISSVHIASRIKQEISGISSSDPRLGGIFTYDNVNYSGYYNFFNIAVYGDNKIVRGMKYAMDHGWNTPYNGIHGGAKYIYDDYVGVNQTTMYYEKFDVSTNDGNYVHQYMQNVAAPFQETNSTYNSYMSLGDYISKDLIFTIPVYDNMSNYAVTAPRIGNPNNYLKDLTIDGDTITGFSIDKYDYEINVPYGKVNIEIGATKIADTSSVIGTGTIKNDSDSKDINIVVTAGNGRTRTYKIKINRLSKEDSDIPEISKILNSSGIKYNDNHIYGINEKTSVDGLINNVKNTSVFATINVKDKNGNNKVGNLATGDIITIGNSEETSEYKVLIYGDINGDGNIDKDDCLSILRQINGYANLGNVYKLAADANKDNKIDKDDCLAILRSLNGYTNLNG